MNDQTNDTERKPPSKDEEPMRPPGRYSSEDLHKAVFAEKPKPRTLAELKDGIRRYIRKHHKRP